VYILDVSNNAHTSHKIGKGAQSQWADKNTIVIAREKSLAVYNVLSKNLIKEYKADDPSGFGDFTIGNTMETLLYASYNGGEGERSKIKAYDLKSRKRRELIIDAENPTYVKGYQ